LGRTFRDKKRFEAQHMLLLLGSVVEIVLNQEACLARSFIRPLQALLASFHVVVNLGET